VQPSETIGTEETRPAVVGLVVVYCKGLAMGAADAVPGVSGGTIAFITGIYERLIRAVTSLDPSVILLVPSLRRQRGRQEFVAELQRMDVPFLMAVGTGMVTAVAILARLVQFALSALPGPTFAFFFGLIGASAVALFERGWVYQSGPAVAALVGFSAAFLVAGETATGTFPHSFPVIFGAGVLAISGMVLPGISGAFILLLLGQYDYMTTTLNEFIDEFIAVLQGSSPDAFLDAALTVVVFVSGALIGLFTIAFAVRAALERYRMATLAFLVSLMLGALRYPGIQVAETTSAWTVPRVAALFAALVAGLGAVLLLDYYTEDFGYEADA
jgi:putative membrane protein